MSGLHVAPEVDDELNVLVETHPADVGLIDALLEELDSDQEALDRLHKDVPKTLYALNAPFEVKEFIECRDYGICVFSLKPFDEDGHRIGFRIFLGHSEHDNRWYVLSVQPRKTCYDTTTDAFRSLVARYERLCVPRARKLR